MQKFKESVRNLLMVSKTPIAVELPPSSKELRRWLVVFPNEVPPVVKSIPDHKFSILEFELDKKLIDEYFQEEDKLNQKRTYVKSEEELYRALGIMEVSLDLFDAPWKSDCPI